MRATLSGFVIVAWCLFCPAVRADENVADTNEANVEFTWALAALQGSGAETEVVVLDKDTTLQSGAEVGMLVRPLGPCFVYVFARKSDGELKLIFPSRLPHPEDEASSAPLREPKTWVIRKYEDGDQETIYVLASVNALTELESRWKRYATTTDDRTELARGIVREIAELRRRHFKPAGVSERPASIGGRFRTTFDITPFARQISATDFFSRVITIGIQ